MMHWSLAKRSALLLGLCLVATTPSPIRADDLPPWPVPVDGDFVHDPAVTWGRLPNGLRYAIMPNQTPPGRVSLRLLIEAGSLMEKDDQRGLAHFLEHMAFKGSQNMAPGDLVHYMQRAGLAFGADTNAATGYDTTTYRLDLPRNEPALLAEGLGIMSEVQGQLLLAPEQIEPERGVILSEKRQRDTPGSRLRDQVMEFLLPGSLFELRDPIGIEEVIRTAPRERFVEFYRDYYTPERSVLVVTGDVDPAMIVPIIQERFGAYAQPAAAAPNPTFPAIAPRALDTLMVSDPGLSATVSLNRVLPYEERPDNIANQSKGMREMLAGALLGRRLDQIGLRPGAPFAGAGAGISDLPKAARLATIRLSTTPETWQAALTAAEQELRRALTFGFAPEELEDMLASIRSRLQTAAASASTQQTSELADQLTDVIADKRIFSSSATDLQLFDRLAAEIEPADVDAALREAWNGPPQIVVSGPMVLAEPKTTILEVYNASAGQPVIAGVAQARAAFAYTEFGQPSGVAATQQIEDLGITRVAFGNGVRLEVKPSTLEAGTVHVAVRFGSGRLGMPPGQQGLNLLADQGFVQGGLGRQSIAELTPILESRQIGLDLLVSDASLVLLGDTTPADLPLQLDLLAAYVTDPGYRPEAMERYQQSLAARYARLDSRPTGALAGPVERMLHAGDPRFGVPPREQAQARTLDELKAWLDPMLRQGPMQVSVVGDIEPARVIEEVGRTFGALPPRGPDVAPLPPPSLAVPGATEIQRFTHQGPAGQAIAAVYWPTTGRTDAPTAIGLDLVADILDDRLLDEVRTREGATYSPQAFSDMSLAVPTYGVLGAVLDVQTTDAERFARVIRDTAAGLAAGGITQDELDRAKQPRLSRARASMQSNEFWLKGVLVGLTQFPQRLEEARRLTADVEAQTLESVQALAARYLDPAKAVTVLVLPAAAL